MREAKKKVLENKKLCNFIKNRLEHSNGNENTCLSALSLKRHESLRRASIKLTFSRSQIVAGISVFFICTSVISFCLKTLPAMRVEIPMRPYVANHTAGMNSSDFYQASTTEANFMLTTTQRPSGLFNRYSVNNLKCSRILLPPSRYPRDLLAAMCYVSEMKILKLFPRQCKNQF